MTQRKNIIFSNKNRANRKTVKQKNNHHSHTSETIIISKCRFNKRKLHYRKVLSIFNIKRDFVAVRIQSNQFTDLKNKTIQGHKDTVAKVIDWYNPQKNAFGIMMGTPRRSADIAKEESRNALNFMIMEKDTFNEKILNSNANLQKKYGTTENSSWVSASVGSLLDKGAKVYPDISCSLRLGEPFIITLPETVRLDVNIHPLKK
ncbi:EspJ family T3SS effector ADP-ribosyltransferase [Escherichia coli]|uniref:EspJ family T3SS effector ADP-ribosyltransferase n=1 Tax=Escherichia coli TaxID=562 RepID=UPI000F0AD03D|nr:EspJ family T3SS effector ADP-ribosyltransferase [Escherichia coli]EFE4119125.1 EspJ family T3SS effector ADP-ribosyltransferase [Escherichia coli]EFJ6052165.1 EspJ family T3SS effector ADP-ribosyltransferase [Escherichia coli]EHA7140658.1 EspJ family T3SS effector ADP-ribosyltransferase [Escherichia coli]EHD8803827.1 EspJ family T3SS effector ADP-ribosyltransferase [Escherichia coli]